MEFGEGVDLAALRDTPPDGPGLGATSPAEPGRLGELEQLRRTASDAAERDFLIGLLKRNKGNISLASRSSGIHRSYLQRLMSKHGLRRG
jgi:transcriptional regulator of acetoin/glycerol metabolism